MSTTARCRCGGSRTQHTGDEGCWGPCCVNLPESERCATFEEGSTPEPRPRETRRLTRNEKAGAEERAEIVSRMRAGSRRKEVYEAIRLRAHHGLTDDELRDVTGRSVEALVATRNTLVDDGLIRESDERRTNLYGTPVPVWVAVGLPTEGRAR